MDIFGRMVNSQSLLLLFILLGVVCQKTGIITRENRGGFNNFLLNITLPAMILNSFLGEVGPDAFAQAGLITAPATNFLENIEFAQGRVSLHLPWRSRFQIID